MQGIYSTLIIILVALKLAHAHEESLSSTKCFIHSTMHMDTTCTMCSSVGDVATGGLPPPIVIRVTHSIADDRTSVPTPHESKVSEQRRRKSESTLVYPTIELRA
jgi:hypothetical protein